MIPIFSDIQICQSIYHDARQVLETPNGNVDNSYQTSDAKINKFIQ